MSGTFDPDRLFDALLKRYESDTLDFKREFHDFSTAQGRDAFVKDVICLANTPRIEPAYLLFGVYREGETGPVVLKGLARQEDGGKNR